MKTRSLLITSLLVAGVAAQAQSVTYTAGSTTETKAIADLAAFSLNKATVIALTGEWTNDNMIALKSAFQEDAGTDGSQSLQTIDLSEAKFKDYLFLSDYFLGCTALNTATMPTESVTIPVDFSNTFSKCPIKSIDLSAFSCVGSFYSTFRNCTELTTVKLPETTTATAEISFNRIFNNCPKLTSIIDLSGFTRLKGLELALAACPLLPSVTLNKDLSGVLDWDNAFLGTSKNFCIYIKAAKADCNLGDMPKAYKNLVKYIDPAGVSANTTDAGFTLAGGKSCITVTAQEAQTVQLVTIDGRTVRTIQLNADEAQAVSGLTAGIYIIKGLKAVVN